MTQELGKVETWTMKVPYDWCLEFNVRPYEPENWGLSSDIYSFGHFHETMMTEEDFLSRLADVKHKTNSRPRKMDEYLELRMYGLVIYQLMGIQQGIQFQHAVTDYQRFLGSTVGEIESNFSRVELGNRYGRWADNWKTSILLNGGTTNDSEQYVGSMQKHLAELRDNGVLVQIFREPDLGNCLTAMCFLVDERVFDRESYLDFTNSPYTWDSKHVPNDATFKKWEDDNTNNYERWVEEVGGPKNAFLREFMVGKKLATN
tara:strand:- start:6487 stop:7266 length:780 start_codon:yes stop_codon:yes gene_type:complete